MSAGTGRTALLVRALFWSALLALVVFASEVRAATAGARVALVVGNAAYDEAPLRNPVNDARAMSERLSALGFEVVTVLDANQPELERAIGQFARRLDEDAVGLFYYAGHGVQMRGRNYLLPINIELNHESDVRIGAVDVGLVLDEMAYAGNRVNLVILDACRNNPFERRFRGSANRGLAPVDAAGGTLIAYATAPGSVAADGAGDNGLYTEALLDALGEPGLSVEQVFKRVRVAVADSTGGQQTPWESSSLTGEFVFNVEKVAEGQPVASAQATGRQSMDGLFWESIRDSDDQRDYEAYLEQFPDGTFAALARSRVARLRAPANEEVSRVEELLALADVDLSALRLTSPAGNNAVEKLRQVLALDPGNARATDGLARVVGRYVEMSDRAITREDFARSRGFLERAERVAPESETIVPARARLDFAAARHAERESERLTAEQEARRAAAGKTATAQAVVTPAQTAAPAQGTAHTAARPARAQSASAPEPARAPTRLKVAIIPGRLASTASRQKLRAAHSQLLSSVLLIRGEPQLDIAYHPMAFPDTVRPGWKEGLDRLWGGSFSTAVDADRAYRGLPELGFDLAFAVYVSASTSQVVLIDPRSRTTYERRVGSSRLRAAVAELWREYLAGSRHARLSPDG